MKKNIFVRFAAVAAMLVVVLLAASTAGYAWFSSNSVVDTSKASGRTDSEKVELLISSQGGNSFKGEHEASIDQVNKTKTDQLMPVSTADLKNFVYSTGTVEDMAVHFIKTKDEEYYYHGRVYLKAVGTDMPKNTRMLLYLDSAKENGGEFFQNTKGYMMNAARLGLSFDDGDQVIFKVSEESNPKKDQVLNTVIDGVKLSGDQVIDSSGSKLKAVKDPSVSIKDYMVNSDGTADSSTKELLKMELNKVYTVDVYFYLEGCDPDCSDVTQLDKLDFHLAFYGVLTEGGN